MYYDKHNFLFYCCYFAPGYETGAIRPTKLAKYFSKYNQNIIVLTQASLEEKNKDLLIGVEKLKIFRIPVKCKFLINDLGFWFAIATYKKLKQLIKNHKIEYLFVSGPPFAPFICAYYLAKRYNLKLIIDYRDLWYGDPYSIVSIKDYFFRMLGRILEKKIMKQALKVNFISHNMMRDQKIIFGNIKNSIVISTGVDSDDLNLINKNIYFNFLARNNLNHEEKIFYYIGTLDETECSKDFFNIILSLSSNRVYDFKIYFIGKNKFNLNKFPKFKSLEAKIKFIPNEDVRVIKNIIKYSCGTIILGGYANQRLNRKVFENLLLTNNIFFLGSADSPSYKLLNKFGISCLATDLDNNKEKIEKFQKFIGTQNTLTKPHINLKNFYKSEISKDFLSRILE